MTDTVKQRWELRLYTESGRIITHHETREAAYEKAHDETLKSLVKILSYAIWRIEETREN